MIIYTIIGKGGGVMRIVKIGKIVLQIGILYLFSFIGTWLVNALHIPLPGSIIGLVLLLIGLITKIVPTWLVKEGAGFLIAVLTLLFVPATVGIIQFPQLLSAYGVLLVLIVCMSTFIAFVLTGKLAKKMEGPYDT